jgi:hypothetical protein
MNIWSCSGCKRRFEWWRHVIRMDQMRVIEKTFGQNVLGQMKVARWRHTKDWETVVKKAKIVRWLHNRIVCRYVKTEVTQSYIFLDSNQSFRLPVSRSLMLLLLTLSHAVPQFLVLSPAPHILRTISSNHCFTVLRPVHITRARVTRYAR